MRLQSTLLWLVLPLMTAGCVGGTYRRGMTHVDDGEFVEATAYWMQALEEDQFDPGPLKGLERWAEAAHDQLLDQARLHEAEGRYEQSLATYDKLIALDERLLAVASLDYGERPIVKTERMDTEEAWANSLLQDGATNLANKKWGASVAAYTKALELRPNKQEARKPLGDAYLGWGHEAREANAYRDAVERYDHAMEFGAGRAATLWSAAVHVALGEYFFEERACRAAARELRSAGEHLEDYEIAEKLALAEDCARVELVIKPFDSVPELTVAGTAPGAMLADQLEASLRERSSEFVFLLDPLANSTQEALGGGLAGQRPGTLFEVRGRITQLAVERPPVADLDKTITGTTKVICPMPEGVYYRSEEWCDEPAAITYTEHSERIIASGAGSVRVIRPRNGEQLLTEPIEASLLHDRSQVRDLRRMVDGESVKANVAAEASEGVIAVPAELLARLEPPPPLPPESQLAAEVSRALAEAAADAILRAVDSEKEVVDPARLTIQEPMVSAKDVNLQGGQMTSEPAQQPEPEPEPTEAPSDAPTSVQMPTPTTAPDRVVVPKRLGGDDSEE